MVSDGETGVLMQNCPKASLRMLANGGVYTVVSGVRGQNGWSLQKGHIDSSNLWSNGRVTLEQTVEVVDKLKLFIIVTITTSIVTIVRHLSADGNLN